MPLNSSSLLCSSGLLAAIGSDCQQWRAVPLSQLSFLRAKCKRAILLFIRHRSIVLQVKESVSRVHGKRVGEFTSYPCKNPTTMTENVTVLEYQVFVIEACGKLKVLLVNLWRFIFGEKSYAHIHHCQVSSQSIKTFGRLTKEADLQQWLLIAEPRQVLVFRRQFKSKNISQTSSFHWSIYGNNAEQSHYTNDQLRFASSHDRKRRPVFFSIR